jgi:hypothetical protein
VIRSSTLLPICMQTSKLISGRSFFCSLVLPHIFDRFSDPRVLLLHRLQVSIARVTNRRFGLTRLPRVSAKSHTVVFASRLFQSSRCCQSPEACFQRRAPTQIDLCPLSVELSSHGTRLEASFFAGFLADEMNHVCCLLVYE